MLILISIKINTQYIEAKTLNKVVANINRFIVECTCTF